MGQNKKLRNTGFLAFFFSGICAISSGIIVSILQEKHGLSFGVTGNLVSVMSIGNMLAAFLSGILPGKIGMRNTVLILSSGYFLGYLFMTTTGMVGVLLAAFLLVGLAKGCALNNCTVLVGSNSNDRTKGMNLMHSCYAFGALLCPLLAAALAKGNVMLPMAGAALAGLAMWMTFLAAKLPGKEKKEGPAKEKSQMAFLRQKRFWLLTLLIFCQNGAETSVTGWLVTYYKNQGILSGTLSAYTVTILWGATLIARLLIAFVFPIKNTFESLAVMGLGCTLFYGIMIFVEQPVLAILMLFAFAFSIAGVNPVAVAGVGKEMSSASMGVMLPLGGVGAIVMPSIIGIVADKVNLQAGMFCNLVPCGGILVLSAILLKEKRKPVIDGQNKDGKTGHNDLKP